MERFWAAGEDHDQALPQMSQAQVQLLILMLLSRVGVCATLRVCR